MLNHIGIYVSEYDAVKKFHQEALKPLGYELIKEFPEWGVCGLGKSGVADLWITKAEATAKVHIAISADDKQTVSAFHAAALAAGGKDNGAPGYRKDYSPGYYAAFVTDPAGNNIEAVFFDPNPSE